MRLQWDTSDYEDGVDRGVFYPPDGPGEVWNGLAEVKESPSFLSTNDRYLDGQKIHRPRKEDFVAAVSAYAYPLSFFDTIMPRRPQKFGMSYRVMKRNGYRIHLVYNAFLEPNPISNSQNSPGENIWKLNSVPVPLPQGGYSAHLIIDTNVAYSWVVSQLEDILYGNDSYEARLPSPQEIFDLFEANAILVVIDNGDGTFTATGPDSVVQMLDATTFQISWPSAVFIDSVSYTLRSL